MKQFAWIAMAPLALAACGGGGGTGTSGGGHGPTCGDSNMSETPSCIGTDVRGQTCGTILGAQASGTVTCSDQCTLVADCDCRLAGGVDPKAPWPMEGFCAPRWGRSPAIGPKSGKVKWSVGRSDEGTNAFAVLGLAVGADGTIYVNRGQELDAITPTGHFKWSAVVQVGGGVGGPVIGADGTIYSGAAAVSPTGKVLWKSNRGVDGISLGPDDTVYQAVNGSSGAIYAVKPSDGSVKWHVSAASSTFSAPAIGSDGTVYAEAIGNKGADVLALDPSGKKKWSTAGGVAGVAGLVDADGDLVLTAGLELHASGKDGWHIATGSEIFRPVLAPDGSVRFGFHDLMNDEHGYLAVLPDGHEKWRYTKGVKSLGNGLALDADGTLYAALGDGDFGAIDADGKLVWQVAHDKGDPLLSPPAIGADGTIYVGTQLGNVVAIGF